MVSTKTYISEYITGDEIEEETIIKFVAAPDFKEGDYGKQLDGFVEINGEKRKITINKGNARRLSAVWGDETEAWKGKSAKIRPPKTQEEKESGTKFVLVPGHSAIPKKSKVEVEDFSEYVEE